MGKSMRWWLVGLLVVCGIAAAQETEKTAKASSPAVRIGSYRLDFTLKELEDGKVVNTRNYSTLVASDTPVRRESFIELRAGSRVPVTAGEKGIQYMDVGVLFNGRLTESDDREPLLNMSIEISSLALPEGAINPGPNPVVRMMRSNVSTALTPGKPMLLTSVDDPNSRHRFQVEVTAAKLR